MTGRVARVALVLTLFAGVPAAGFAQDRPAAACDDVLLDQAQCYRVAVAAEALLPVVALAAAGGSPVPGTASTLGMRLTSMPRWSLNGRLTGARADAPAVGDRTSDGATTVAPLAIALDASVGVLPGWNPLPTVGGIASLDAVATVGFVPVTAGGGLGGDGGWTWGAGVRLGILRESFTLPGVSLSGMYRQLRDVDLGDADLEVADAHIAGDYGVLSLRAAASKSVLLFHLTGGVGYDVLAGDVEMAWALPPTRAQRTGSDRRMDRLSAFGELSYTLMVVHFVVGGGWQEGPPATGDAALDGHVGDAVYATASLRMSI